MNFHDGGMMMMCFVLLAHVIVLPLATPFVVGTSSSSGPNSGHVPYASPPPPSAAAAAATFKSAAARSSPLGATSNAAASSSSVPPPPPPPLVTKDDTGTSSTSSLNPKVASNFGVWQAGETNAGVLSKLLFQYVSPLLQVASERDLEVSDAMQIPTSQRVDPSVNRLTLSYHASRRRAMTRQARRRQKQSSSSSFSLLPKRRKRKRESSKTGSKEESMILLSALLQLQKSNLIVTACLRLLNTLIQAFPSLFVGRLLRFIEQGNKHSPAKALGAAASLIAILTCKMIVENQLFHRTVQMASQTRGALAGLIFDKSLRLGTESRRISSQQQQQQQALLQQDDDNNKDEKETTNNEKKKRKNKKNTNNNNDNVDKSMALGAGGVLNLMQSDTSILESTAMQIHTSWDGPCQIAMYSILLYRCLGSAMFYGIAALLTVIPLNSIALRLQNRVRDLEVKDRELRTKRTTEAISNMKLLKLQSWTTVFARRIQRHRQDELDRHFMRGIIRSVNSALTNVLPALVLVVTLRAYANQGKPIVASTIFTAISLFNQLRFPLYFYPTFISALANGQKALERVASYLSLEQIVSYVEMKNSTEGGRIEMTNGNFLWSSGGGEQRQSNQAAAALSGVNVAVEPGQVVAVVGSVGSGKSALIKGMLGELSPVPRAVVSGHNNNNNTTDDLANVLAKPRVVSTGSIGYCSQEPWLPKGTLKDAVVFGREYDEERYLAALHDAGLDDDMVEDDLAANSKAAASRGVLSHSTNVGEGGSSLSGGQRARVALARALYGNDAKVFLLDDPLAALDASVGSIVFERLLKRLRSSKSATLLVTNDPNIPRRCDRVILMGKSNEATSSSSSSCSTIIDVGTYDELIARGHNLKSLSAQDEEDDEDEENVDDINELIEISPSVTNQTEAFVKVTTNYVPQNSTIHMHHNRAQSQHADPDCIECMKDHPDCVAEKKIPKWADHNDDDEETTTSFEQAQNKADTTTTTTTSATTTQVKEEMAKPAPPIIQNSSEKKIASADDKMEKGAVKLKTYLAYFKSVGNPLLVVGMVACYIFACSAQFYQQRTVAKWTEIGRSQAMATALRGQYLQRLVSAAYMASAFLFLRGFSTMLMGIKASNFLHERMLQSVFKAPMSFFDATPSGQLLSRFGKEMETVDTSLPESIGAVLFCFFQILFSGAVLAGGVTPAMAAPLVAVGFLYVRTMRRYRPGARGLKRAESKSRSPIYTHFAEALRGTEIIRSMPNAIQRWSASHRKLSDTNIRVFSSVKALDRWLSLRLESLGNVVVLVSAILSIFLTRRGVLKSGSAGWGLTQALAITGLLSWAVRTLTDLETNTLSMVRLQEVTDLESEETKGIDEGEEAKPKMPKEQAGPGDAMVSLYQESGVPLQNITMAPATDAALVESGWPWKGNIEFKNVSMRYNSISPLVLKDVTVTVPPGTTLGVVGRTGSGKSSLLVTLFRLVEIEAGGEIKIDGVDIRSVSLDTLRSSLSIIPQDPVLFAGSLMYNLDATGKASPQDAWAALEAASPELALQFRNANGLDSYISEGGKNLSSGQRQLICLARALLRKSKILVMDEATSAVDSKTDARVQETIRREFVDRGVTVLTVAHRLDTVLGYDKIAVLGDGNLIEYGTPATLLRNPRGELRRLVEADRQNKRKGAAVRKTSTTTAQPQQKKKAETPIAVAKK